MATRIDIMEGGHAAQLSAGSRFAELVSPGKRFMYKKPDGMLFQLRKHKRTEN